jgi:hypothetical protein
MDNLKQYPVDVGLDSFILLQLGSIHPTRLLDLTGQTVELLASITGCSRKDSVFAPLRHIRTERDLALIDWQEMGEEIARRGALSQEASVCAISSLKVLFERIELHYVLYQAYSSTTLRLFYPEMMTANYLAFPELHQAYQEFEQVVSKADKALHTGRALSLQFQRTIALLRKQLYAGALAGAWWVCLQEMLARMRACALRYEHMLERAFEIQGCINWYVTQVEDDPGKEHQTGNAA